MSLQNRQKYETIEDQENQIYEYPELKSSRRSTKALSKYVVITIVVISVIFFTVFIMTRESAEQVKRKKMQDLANQYKVFNKGPQIHSKQFPPKDKQKDRNNENREEEEESQSDKKDSHFLGKDKINQNEEQEDENHHNSDLNSKKEQKLNEKEREDQNKSQKDDEKNDNFKREENDHQKKENSKTNDQKETKSNQTKKDRKKREDILDDDDQYNKKIKQLIENEAKRAENTKKDDKKHAGEEKHIGGGKNYIPMDEENEKTKRIRQSFIDTRKENKIFVCPEESYYYGIICDDCPDEFQADEYDRLCKHVDMNPMQIEMRQYPEPDLEDNKDNQKIISEYYQIIKSEDLINNQQAKYGFIFFNQFENGGFNFLNTQFGGKLLNKFLTNIDGLIVTLSGEESYYLGNQAIIEGVVKQTKYEYPQIKKWYAIGLFDVGSYGAIKYLSVLKTSLDGVIVLDPNYMNMVDYYGTLIDWNLFDNSDLFEIVKKEKDIFKTKDILVIESEQSKAIQHTQNFASYTNANVIRYNNSTFINNNDKIEHLLFSHIEQFVSQKNKDILNKKD